MTGLRSQVSSHLPSADGPLRKKKARTEIFHEFGASSRSTNVEYLSWKIMLLFSPLLFVIVVIIVLP